MPLNRICTTALLAVLSYAGYSQDIITGTWTGNSAKSFWVVQSNRIVVELSLYNDSLLTGASHLYYDRGQYEHYKLYGKYNKQDSTATFSEDSVIGINIGRLADNCTGVYIMKLSKQGNKLLLNGVWRDKKRGMFRCPTVDTWFEREIDEPRKDAAHQGDTSTTVKPVTIDPALSKPDSLLIPTVQEIARLV